MTILGRTAAYDFKEAAAAQVLAIDTETSGMLDIRDGRGYAMGLSISYYKGTKQVSHYFPFRHKNGQNITHEEKQQVKALIESAPIVVFHNAKFDLVSLGTLGIQIKGQFYDTMLMMHMIDENFYNKGLDAVAKYRLNDAGKNRSKDMSGFLAIMGWEDAPPELIYEYAAYDADLTLRLFHDLLIDFASQGFQEIWPIEEKFTRALVNMERRGVLIDQELCKTQKVIGEVRMAEIRKELGLNPGSPKDLTTLLIDRLQLPVVAVTPGGKPSFNKVAMEKYDNYLEAMDSPVAGLVLEFRGWQKTVSSNYSSYLELLSPDGRLRPNYKIHGTVTGRLSCEKPNLQQIPRQSNKPWNGQLKSAFIARDGYILYEADYSQIEFRLASAYSKDQNLIDVFNGDEDIFTTMASELGMSRQRVKTLTYATLYGGGITRLATLFNTTQEEASILRDTYFQTYPGLKLASRAAANLARKQGYIQYWTGRRRHFDDPESQAHKAFNALVQGGASEIVKRALIQCDYEFEGDPECRLLLTVHDSLVFEINEYFVPHYAERIKDIMEFPVGVPDFGVRLKVEGKQWNK